MLVFPSESLGPHRVLNSHHLAFWRYVRDKYPHFVPCVAGSAATVQAEHNNAEFNNSINDVDLWIKETVDHYLTVDDVYQLVAEFNLAYPHAELKPSRIVVGYSPFGVDRRNTVGLSSEVGCRISYLRGYKILKLGLIVDLQVIEPHEGPTTRSFRSICTPIQLVSLFCYEFDPVPFPKRVVKGFDLSCVQCWLASPYRPTKVEFLDPMVEQDIMCKTMSYDLSKYRDPKTFEERIGKYMDRGYVLKRMHVGRSLMLSFDNAALLNLSTGSNHSGDASYLTQVFHDLRNRHSQIITAIAEGSRRRRNIVRIVRRRSSRLGSR